MKLEVRGWTEQLTMVQLTTELTTAMTNEWLDRVRETRCFVERMSR
jgi:hypothetical protein